MSEYCPGALAAASEALAHVAMNDFIWAPVLAGIVLACTALLDIFMTVLHTQIESPISNGLTRNVHESCARMLVIMQGMVATLRYGLDSARYTT